ncbi:MAG: diguanylate cyclase, partial [Micromonosporaceae bacterium]
MDARDIRPDGCRLWLCYLVVGSAAAVVQYLLPLEGFARVLGYVLVSGSAAAAIWVGVIRNQPRPRLPWLVLALGQVVYTAADATFYMSRYVLNVTAFPGIADLLYLGHYPLIVAGLVLLIRNRTPGRDIPGVLDAAVVAVAVALLSWVFLIAPRVSGDAPLLVRATLVAYPVADLSLLIVSIRLIMGVGRRSPSFFLLTGSLLAIFTADTLYVVQQITGTYQTGNFLDLIWLGGNLTLGAAALHPTMRRLGEPAAALDHRLRPVRMIVLLGAVLLGPALLLIPQLTGIHRHRPVIAVACAILGALVIARMAGLVADQRRLAITDDLTGLHTRRFLESRLTAEIARAERNGGQLAIFIIDVDHFKSVNDRYGHPSGDQALVEIADRLREAVRPGDVLGRYGGEEFAVVVPGIGPDQMCAVAERIRNQVAGTPITVSGNISMAVTVSVGAASYPVHDTRFDELIAVADRALYAAKARGRDCAVVGGAEPIPATGDADSRHAMLRFLRHVASYVDLRLAPEEHSRAIARWVEMLAVELGLDEAAVRHAVLAGELHDIGKVVVPGEILVKDGPLTAEELTLLRQHPEHGARLAQLVSGLDPVADIIAQHHERFDGTGYPRQLAGARIRVEARIVAVCDAWAAMLANRPYQPALTPERAREQLEEGSGGQFDPDIVELFLDLQSRGRVGELQLLDVSDGDLGEVPDQVSALSASVFQ